MNIACLSILIQIYYDPEKEVNLHKQFFLLEEGLIESANNSDSLFWVTARGRCHVEALLRVGLPTSIWRSPIPDEIEE